MPLHLILVALINPSPDSLEAQISSTPHPYPVLKVANCPRRGSHGSHEWPGLRQRTVGTGVISTDQRAALKSDCFKNVAPRVSARVVIVPGGIAKESVQPRRVPTVPKGAKSIVWPSLSRLAPFAS